MNPTEKEQRNKIALVGNQGVGKTCLVKRLKDKIFDENASTTIGSAIYFEQLETFDGEIPISIWDTAGQEQYRAIVPQYIRNSKCVIIVCSADNLESVEAIDSWIQEVRSILPGEVPIMLAVSKIDLVGVNEINPKIESYKAKFDDMCYVSALTGESVEMLFSRAAVLAKEYCEKDKENALNSIIFPDSAPEPEEKCAC